MNDSLAFLVGAGGLSALIYWLTTRTENSDMRRRAWSDGRFRDDYSSSNGSSTGSAWSAGSLLRGLDASSCTSDGASALAGSCGGDGNGDRGNF